MIGLRSAHRTLSPTPYWSTIHKNNWNFSLKNCFTWYRGNWQGMYSTVNLLYSVLYSICHFSLREMLTDWEKQNLEDAFQALDKEICCQRCWCTITPLYYTVWFGTVLYFKVMWMLFVFMVERYTVVPFNHPKYCIGGSNEANGYCILYSPMIWVDDFR